MVYYCARQAHKICPYIQQTIEVMGTIYLDVLILSNYQLKLYSFFYRLLIGGPTSKSADQIDLDVSKNCLQMKQFHDLHGEETVPHVEECHKTG